MNEYKNIVLKLALLLLLCALVSFLSVYAYINKHLEFLSPLYYFFASFVSGGGSEMDLDGGAIIDKMSLYDEAGAVEPLLLVKNNNINLTLSKHYLLWLEGNFFLFKKTWY